MNTKNLLIFLAVAVAMVWSFINGGYSALMPIFFLAGLVIAVCVGGWQVTRVTTTFLVLFLFFALGVAAVDEYAHTSAGTLVYFDHGIPSLLTVLGWGIFMPGILFIAGLLERKTAFVSLTTIIVRYRYYRILPVIITCSLIAAMVLVQGYAGMITPLLLLVYLVLTVCAGYYAYRQPLTWILSLFIASVVVGGIMESGGAWEGLWYFHFNEPISLFILFSWPLRIWTVLGLCLLFGSDIRDQPELPDQGNADISS